MTWHPHIRLDLNTASTRAFSEALETFEEWRKTQQQQPPELDLTNGWKVITPEIAEAMLIRNPLSANRRPTLSTVKYYARQMLGNDWKKTGQPVIFTDDGVLLDAGHRLWASYLSGATFETYLVGDVPNDGAVFAYIDNAKARTAADALSTAGLNGLAKQIGQIINIAAHYDQGAYTPTTKKKLGRMSPREVVVYATEHENLRLGARLMAGEYKSAAAVIAFKDVAAFVAFKIIDLHDEDTLDHFMGELGSVDGEPQQDSAIAALQKVLTAEETSKDPMNKHQILGHVIKAFNAWYLEEPVKRLFMRVNEPFPQFVNPQPTEQPEPTREAAE